MNPVLKDSIVDELKLHCMICDKSIGGFYTRFGNGGVCNKTCMQEQDKKPRYTNDEASFLKRFNL